VRSTAVTFSIDFITAASAHGKYSTRFTFLLVERSSLPLLCATATALAIFERMPLLPIMRDMASAVRERVGLKRQKKAFFSEGADSTESQKRCAGFVLATTPSPAVQRKARAILSLKNNSQMTLVYSDNWFETNIQQRHEVARSGSTQRRCARMPFPRSFSLRSTPWPTKLTGFAFSERYVTMSIQSHSWGVTCCAWPCTRSTGSCCG
jgi:hypothetical protein